MSEPLECGVTVSKIVKTVSAKDGKIVATLLGSKTIVHKDASGFDIEDTVEVDIKVKCEMTGTLARLGISGVFTSKILTLQDRDATLQSFDIPEEEQEQIA